MDRAVAVLRLLQPLHELRRHLRSPFLSISDYSFLEGGEMSVFVYTKVGFDGLITTEKHRETV